MDNEKLFRLRKKITECLRVQRGGIQTIPYIDLNNVLVDICACQNHAIFGRRGCGKTLLLHYSNKKVDELVKCIYLNCEDFKHHSFPNVLIEILDALFKEIEVHLTGWFGKKKRSRALIAGIRRILSQLTVAADKKEDQVRETKKIESGGGFGGGINGKIAGVGASVDANYHEGVKSETERIFREQSDKMQQLNILLPRLKEQVAEFFKISTSIKSIFMQIDDLYHLKRSDQPYVVDYIHRLCKDVPLYFKIATLRHASVLYIDRDGQPIGAQERHDYQPVNIDFTLSGFKKTCDQNRKILFEFGRLAEMDSSDIEELFRGEGFERLVMAGGGVPRDFLSLFLELLSNREVIGKDDVRILSRSNFERRIEDLKHDSEGTEQDVLMRGIYVIKEFCLNKKVNLFLISERMLQQKDDVKNLIYRLLDYRIIHAVGNALTHKSKEGTFQAFSIDIGCYAHLRKLDNRFNEILLSERDAKEKMRSAPVLEWEVFDGFWKKCPQNIENAIVREEEPV